jgi:hypothetical protein
MITEQDLEFIEGLLSEADEYGLTAEVVAAALYEIQNNPDMSVKEAMMSGFVEWIK